MDVQHTIVKLLKIYYNTIKHISKFNEMNRHKAPMANVYCLSFEGFERDVWEWMVLKNNMNKQKQSLDNPLEGSNPFQ